MTTSRVRRRATRWERSFARSEAILSDTIPIRKTVTGVWVPTPLSVVDRALGALEDIGLFSVITPRPAVDAGTGDGRLACVLSAAKLTPTVYAVERDPTLFAQALANVRELETIGDIGVGCLRLVEGDYADPQSYTAAQLDFRETGLVFNYPDGNEQRLAAFVADYGGDGTRLCLLTPDNEVEIKRLRLLVERDILVTDELPWRLSVYART